MGLLADYLDSFPINRLETGARNAIDNIGGVVFGTALLFQKYPMTRRHLL
jgi:hypothetical protein